MEIEKKHQMQNRKSLETSTKTPAKRKKRISYYHFGGEVRAIVSKILCMMKSYLKSREMYIRRVFGGGGWRRGYYVCESVGNIKYNGHKEAVKKECIFVGWLGGIQLRRREDGSNFGLCKVPSREKF